MHSATGRRDGASLGTQVFHAAVEVGILIPVLVARGCVTQTAAPQLQHVEWHFAVIGFTMIELAAS